jgi:hypothetical protein
MESPACLVLGVETALLLCGLAGAGPRRKRRQLGVWLHRSLLTEAAERYFELLKDAKVKGYLFAQQNYVDDGLSKQ